MQPVRSEPGIAVEVHVNTMYRNSTLIAKATRYGKAAFHFTPEAGPEVGHLGGFFAAIDHLRSVSFETQHHSGCIDRVVCSIVAITTNQDLHILGTCQNIQDVRNNIHGRMIIHSRESGQVVRYHFRKGTWCRSIRLNSHVTGPTIIFAPPVEDLPLTEVAELVDAHVSGACDRKVVRVRVPPSVQMEAVPRWTAFLFMEECSERTRSIE